MSRIESDMPFCMCIYVLMLMLMLKRGMLQIFTIKTSFTLKILKCCRRALREMAGCVQKVKLEEISKGI